MSASDPGLGQRVLFVQTTEPAGYPPLMNAASLMADAGWDVTFLSAPIALNMLELPRHPRIALRAIPVRPSHVIGKTAYLRYATAAVRLALRLQPDVVYASDPLGAWPGLLAAGIVRACLVYHEHDSPMPGSLRPWLARLRRLAAQRARLVIFPNEARARIAQAELGFPINRLRIIWNLPRKAELPPLYVRPDQPLIIHYHGSITPDRLPMAVAEAVRRLSGRACLRIVGREAPGAIGYVRRLLEGRCEPVGMIRYAGQVPHHADLVATAARAHVGLALMPCHTDNVNMLHMTGASNKPFDYMAAGLALLVSDLPDWREMYVEPGYARGCDPKDPDSIAAVLSWFIDHSDERRTMAASGRAKIESTWNYDCAFAPILAALSSR